MQAKAKKFQIDVTEHHALAKELQFPGLVVLEVYAGWAGPCRPIDPIFRNHYVDLMDRKLRFVRVASELVPWLRRFHGHCRPVFLFIVAGRLRDLVVGLDIPRLDALIPALAPEEEQAVEEFDPTQYFLELDDDELYRDTVVKMRDTEARATMERDQALNDGLDTEIVPELQVDALVASLGPTFCKTLLELDVPVEYFGAEQQVYRECVHRGQEYVPGRVAKGPRDSHQEADEQVVGAMGAESDEGEPGGAGEPGPAGGSEAAGSQPENYDYVDGAEPVAAPGEGGEAAEGGAADGEAGDGEDRQEPEGGEEGEQGEAGEAGEPGEAPAGAQDAEQPEDRAEASDARGSPARSQKSGSGRGSPGSPGSLGSGSPRSGGEAGASDAEHTGEPDAAEAGDAADAAEPGDGSVHSRPASGSQGEERSGYMDGTLDEIANAGGSQGRSRSGSPGAGAGSDGTEGDGAAGEAGDDDGGVIYDKEGSGSEHGSEHGSERGSEHASENGDAPQDDEASPAGSLAEGSEPRDGEPPADGEDLGGTLSQEGGSASQEPVDMDGDAELQEEGDLAF